MTPLAALVPYLLIPFLMTTGIILVKSDRLFFSICITLSFESTAYLIPSALAQSFYSDSPHLAYIRSSLSVDLYPVTVHHCLTLLTPGSTCTCFTDHFRLPSRTGMGDGGGGHCLVWMEWCPAGWSMCLPLLIIPCTIKSKSSLLALAYLGGPRKRAVKRLWCGSSRLHSFCYISFY